MATALKTLVKNVDKLLRRTAKQHQNALERDYKNIVKALVSELNTKYVGGPFEDLYNDIGGAGTTLGAIWLEWDHDDVDPSDPSPTVKAIKWDGTFAQGTYDPKDKALEFDFRVIAKGEEFWMHGAIEPLF